MKSVSREVVFLCVLYLLTGCGEVTPEEDTADTESDDPASETPASEDSSSQGDFSTDTATCGQPKIQSSEIPEYLDQTAAGKHNNEDWSFAGGEVYRSTFFGKEVYKITLFPDTTTPSCNSLVEEEGDDRRILLQTGLEVGEYPFSETSYSLTFTFKIGGDFRNVTNPGNIEVTELSDTEMSGRLAVARNDCFHVNGTFTLPICQDE